MDDSERFVQQFPREHRRETRNEMTNATGARLVMLATVGFAAGMAQAAGPLEIEYGYPDQSIFVATVNAKGQPDSPMTHLAEALMVKAGMPWHAEAYPAPRLYKNLQDGTTNFSILVRNSALESCCLFSRQPVYRTELNVYHLGDKPTLRSKEELAGKSVIIIRGYSYAGLLKFVSDPAQRITLEVAATHRAGFDMLAARRADYLLDYASAAADILAENPVANLKSDPLDRLEIHLVLSKTYPDAERLMERLETIAGSLNVSEVLKRKY